MNNRVGDNLIHFGGNEEVVRALVQCGVRFVVVGGLAVAWHCHERTADDIDLLVEPTPENSDRIAQALTRLHLGCAASASFAKPGLQVPLKELHYAELLTPQADGPSFASVEASAVDGKLFNMPVRIASVSDLIMMKERALAAAEEQRLKHAKDIQLLKAHGA